MTCAVLITPLVKDIPLFKDCDYIGVDAGALKLLDAHIPMKMAVGDFDSMDPKDLNRISCPIERHPIMKDETDSELAIRLCKDYDTIILYGGISGRLDHTIANIRLAMYQYPNLVLMDEHQKLTILQKGKYCLKNEYSHISFYPIVEGTLTLQGFLYPLESRRIHMEEIYTTSNSLVEKEGTVIVEEGSFLCVQSNWR